MNPHEEEHDFRESGSRVVQDISRFDQAGRARGVLQFGGKTISLDEETWWGHRDRSWGTRRPLRIDAADARRTAFAPFLFSWPAAQFHDYALHWRFVERNPGKYTYLSGEKAAPARIPTRVGVWTRLNRVSLEQRRSGPDVNRW